MEASSNIDPNVPILQRALAREKRARKAAEQILEEKSTELYHLTQELIKSKDALSMLLEEKNNELSGLIQRIIDPYTLVDLEGNVISYNAAADKLLGLAEAMSTNSKLNLMHLVRKEDRTRLAEAFSDMIRDGYVKDVTLMIHDAQGDSVHLQINAAVLYDNDKNPKAAQGIARDITNLKLLEEQKDQLLNQLVSRNDALNEYAHVVSHDLKGPLRGINTLMQLIQMQNKDALNEQSAEYFDMIGKSIRKMDNQISSILTYSKAGLMVEEKKEVDVKQLILDIRDQIMPTKQIDLVFASDMPIVLSHRNQLEQVVHNLMSNAIKFSPEEHARITWRCTQEDDKYELSIQDNGIGIEEKFFDKIFQLFQSLSVRQDSSGVGLAIVKKVVNALGGEVWLTSEYGIGTTFYFTIPKSTNS